MTPSKNGTVWKVASGALALFVLTTGAMYGMVKAQDILPRSEFALFKDTVEHRLERIEDKLDRLLEKE